jgi:hypothetical protein
VKTGTGSFIIKPGKFADYSKVAKRVESVHDAEILQDSLTRMQQWDERWGIKFNKKKCTLARTMPGTGAKCWTMSLTSVAEPELVEQQLFAGAGAKVFFDPAPEPGI